MPTTLTHEAGATFRLDVGGTLHKADMDALASACWLARLPERGAVRLLVVLNRFSGWADGENWNDLSFYSTHGERIERIAIVAEDRWRDQALMFVGAGLRKAPVEFFVPGAISIAREWLAE